MSPRELSYWFSREIKPHEGELRGYLYPRVNQHSDVDDIVQESFRRIVEVKRSQPIPSPKGLLFTIAKNLLKDFFRKKSNSRTSFVAEMEDLSVIDNETTPNDVASIQDEIKVLREAIQSLPPKCKKILILRKMENLSQKAIAERLNVSVHTVETQLTRGLKKCQKHFEKRGILKEGPRF